MARKAATQAHDFDKILLEAYGLAVGCRAQAPDESNADFNERIYAEFGEIIAVCEGSIELAAIVFGMDDRLLHDIAGTNDVLKSQWRMANALETAREKRGEEAAADLKEELVRQASPDKYKYKRKKVWPKDPAARKKQITKALTELGAMRDYNGSTIQMASPMQLTPDELDAVIQSSPDLIRLQKIEQTRDDAAAERNLLSLAATGTSATAPMKVLTNRHPEKYSDKQQIDVKNTGFAPPTPDTTPKSVLFKEKEKCDDED